MAAVEQGVQTSYIEQAAYEAARRLESGHDLVVGVNVFQVDEAAEFASQLVDPQLESDQKLALREYRLRRQDEVVQARLTDLVAVAAGPTNVVPAIRDAFGAGATLGEISDALRSVFGVFGE